MKERMFLQILHLRETKPAPEELRLIQHLIDEHEASAQALRSQLRVYGVHGVLRRHRSSRTLWRSCMLGR